jgi:glucan phosphoethanolaminetransferase (alkaline phosphatase superfamily)
MSLVHIHLLLNHVAVVGALVAVLLFAAALLLRDVVSTKFALAFTAGLAVVAIAVYFTGEPAEDAVEHLAGVTKASIHEHEEAAELTTIVIGVLGGLSLLALLWLRSRRAPRWMAAAGVVGTLAISALMGWTANLGGQIRHTEIQGANPSSYSD